MGPRTIVGRAGRAKTRGARRAVARAARWLLDGVRMQTLADKRVLITGAASGIGKALAARAASERAAPVLGDGKQPLLAQTAGELARQGARVATHVLDITDVSRITGLSEAVHRDGGPIDVL